MIADSSSTQRKIKVKKNKLYCDFSPGDLFNQFSDFLPLLLSSCISSLERVYIFKVVCQFHSNVNINPQLYLTGGLLV